MIKVIISHDVDHLFARDHWFRDLIYPKMWIRTTLQFVRHEITGREWFLRNSSCFRKSRHNLDAMMKYDREHGIPSTFFFGMSKGLGMSYKPEEAAETIKNVKEQGFSVGVHGIDFQNYENMLREYKTFENTVGFPPEGIRMHYVRFDSGTFEKLSHIGYAFDSTEFNKEDKGTRKDPYKVGSMWEFPLTIMDGYLPQQYMAAKQNTLELLQECKTRQMEYISVLFHDYQFCDDYKDIRNWYMWLMEYFSESPEYSFISYQEAVRQLEVQRAEITSGEDK